MTNQAMNWNLEKPIIQYNPYVHLSSICPFLFATRFSLSRPLFGLMSNDCTDHSHPHVTYTHDLYELEQRVSNEYRV